MIEIARKLVNREYSEDHYLPPVLLRNLTASANDGVWAVSMLQAEAKASVADVLKVASFSRLLLRFFSTVEDGSISASVILYPPGNALGLRRYYGAISTGAAMPANIHPQTGLADTDSWFEAQGSAPTFSVGAVGIEEQPSVDEQMADYQQAMLIDLLGNEGLRVIIHSQPGSCIVTAQIIR